MSLEDPSFVELAGFWILMNAFTAMFFMLSTTELTLTPLSIVVLGVVWTAPPTYMVKKSADLAEKTTDGDSGGT